MIRDAVGITNPTLNKSNSYEIDLWNYAGFDNTIHVWICSYTALSLLLEISLCVADATEI
jgi:hypothetical protein